MAQFTYQGAYPRYYPTLSLFTKPGETHELDSAPDAQWAAVHSREGTESTPVAVPAISNVAQANIIPQAESPADELTAAEALLAANPALAHKLIEEAAQNA
jgi:hypothetical protein